MDEKIEELKQFALDNYTHGGHWMVECWEQRDWVTFIERCQARGLSYEKELKELWVMLESQAEDIKNS